MLTFSPGLSSSLLQATTKAQWCQIIIDALGTNRRLICKRSDSDGDVWGTGTTFLNAALTGTMNVQDNELANLGVVGAITTQAASNLGSGFAVMRIEGATSSVWVQGTIGLVGSGRDFLLRADLTATGMGVGIDSAAVIKAPSRLPLTPPDPPPGGVINTLSLVNTSGSTQAANFVTPWFGMPLKQGDCPAGKHIRFELDDGTECPHTPTNVGTWPDGSRKMAGYIMRVPSAIAGSGTLNINVKTTDTAPGSSSRTTADLTAADLKLEVTGVTGLTGLWTASLNDGITRNTEIVEVGNGPAGRVWRIGSEFRDGSANAHGGLYMHHHVLALQNSSGGLLGLRYLGRALQAWADVTSPAIATRVMTGVLKSGATTIRTLQGTSASETAQANISMDAYTSFATVGTDGKYDYVQGGGSAAADCTVRIVHGKTNFIRTKQVSAYNHTLSVSSSPSIDYRPFCAGQMQRYTPGTGERFDIGIMPTWMARHLLTQSAVDERAVRVNALAAGGWRTCVRTAATKNVLACVDIQASYTNLTMQTGWRFWPDAYMTGCANPPSWSSYWAEEFCSHHRPANSYYAYLLTGETQYMDQALEVAATTMLNMEPNTQAWNTTQPITNPVTGNYGERGASFNGTTYKGAGLFFRQDVYRIPAWGSRDVAGAASILPDSGTQWTGARSYLRDILTRCAQAIDAYNALMPQSWRDGGLWTFIGRGPNDTDNEGPWALGYMMITMCYEANILPGLGLDGFRSHLAKFPMGIYNIGSDVASIASYRMSQWLDNNQRVTMSSQLVFQVRDCTLTFSSSTNRFTTSGPNSGWTPADGDVFMFQAAGGASKPFPEAVDNRRLYAVQCSGNTGKLSLTPGGAEIAVPSNMSTANFYMRGANFSPRFSYEGYVGADAYVSIMFSAFRNFEACGEASINPARVRQDALWTASATSFASDPKNAMLPSYPT